jgi:hypothetical protein
MVASGSITRLEVKVERLTSSSDELTCPDMLLGAQLDWLINMVELEVSVSAVIATTADWMRSSVELESSTSAVIALLETSPEAKVKTELLSSVEEKTTRSLSFAEDPDSTLLLCAKAVAKAISVLSKREP